MAQLVQAGTAVKGTGDLALAVAFPTPYIDVPVVVLQAYNPNGPAVGAVETLTSLSATGFTSTSAVQNAYINWIAVGDIAD